MSEPVICRNCGAESFTPGVCSVCGARWPAAGFPTRNLQDLVRLIAKGIGDSLDDTFGPRVVGHALMIFDFGDVGSFAYASNAQRAEMISALEELVAKLKAPPAPADA